MAFTRHDTQAALLAKTAAFARGAVLWERRTLGLGRHVPLSTRQTLRRMLGIAPVQEGRRYRRGPLADLFAALDRDGVRYVVLRWFEGLPDDPEGDVDLLVADEDCGRVEALLEPAPPGTPCDLFDVSGQPGYRYARRAYLPRALAVRILERREVRGGIAIPCAADHFDSLAYHAVYQKGLASGLASDRPGLVADPEPAHDYAGTLDRLAKAAGLAVAIRLEPLEAYLADAGWRPDPVTLSRLAATNRWLAHHPTEGARHGRA